MTTNKQDVSLSVQTATGAGWIIGWRLVTRALGLVSTFVLARFLLPGDFGLVALAGSFSQAVDWLSDFGVEEALIRDTDHDRELYDTGFTVNLLRSVVIAAIIAAGAWPVARFFEDMRLVPILLVLAGAMAVRGVENIGIVDFRRDLAFEKEFRLFVLPRMFGIAAAILVAVLFASYWALVAGIVTNRTGRTVMSYVMHPYRPRLTLAGWRRLIGFSAWSWSIGMVTMVRDRLDAVVIGRVLGPGPVGIFAIGWEIGMLTSTELVEPLCRALLSGFSAARRAGTSVAKPYLDVVAATFLLTMPMGFGLSLAAAPIVRLMLGAQWVAAVPLVQVFALIGMLKVIGMISGTLCTTYGLLAVQFRIALLSTIIRFTLLVLLVSRFGVVGGAVAAMGSFVVEETYYLVVTFRHFELRMMDLLRATWRPILATACMVGVLLLEGGAWAPAVGDLPLVLGGLALTVLSGAAAYAVSLTAIWVMAGRPEGAETYVLGMASRTIRHLMAARRRRAPIASPPGTR